MVQSNVEEKTAGGIIIPVGAKSMEATEGTVIDVGAECTDVGPGDIVFFGKYSGAEIERNGGKYVVMNEEDVIAKVKKVDA
jgi:chaperonin GroES